MKIKIKEIFTSIQGEGRYAGTPAIFVRVGACNCSCSFCDTTFETKDEVSIEKARKLIRDEYEKNMDVRHIVITGGEPAIYAEEIEKIFQKYDYDNTEVTFEIETNGVVLPDWANLLGIYDVFVTISPKIEEHFELYDIRKPYKLKRNTCLKLVVTNEMLKDMSSIFNKLRIIYPDYSKSDIYLQPVDVPTKNGKSYFKIAKQLIANNVYGCNLSVQLHKILGVK